MEVVKTICLKFSDEDKEILNRTLEVIHLFSDSDACEALECHNCPFEGLCNHNTAETIERHINNILSR